MAWPRDAGANLGPVGAYNFFLRLGHSPRWLASDNLDGPGQDDLVIVAASGTPDDKLTRRLLEWQASGPTVLLSGRLNALAPLLQGVQAQEGRVHHPGGGLGLADEDDRLSVLAPPRWPFIRVNTASPCGRLAEIGGDRQSPRRALVRRIEGAPGAFPVGPPDGRMWFLNGQPFAALQAWLQAQEDLSPWLTWGDRMTWLDGYVDGYATVLERWLRRPLRGAGLAGVAPVTVTLRHDTDCSADDVFLGIEDAYGVPATWPILDDDNTEFWVQRLHEAVDHEAAFHYSSVYRSSPAQKVAKAALGRLGWRLPEQLRPAGRQVVAGGLLRQMNRAKARGIPTTTIHRHFGFVQYPEIIEALDSAYRNGGCVGSSTFFRGQVLRWVCDRVDGATSTVMSGSDVLTPYWFPFRLANAADDGRMLDGWEATTAIEPEPGLALQLLERQHDLPHRFVMLTYHPAHGRSSAFTPGGTQAWVREVLASAVNAHCRVMTCHDYLDAVAVAVV